MHTPSTVSHVDGPSRKSQFLFYHSNGVSRWDTRHSTTGGEPGLPAHTVLPQVLPTPSHHGRKSSIATYSMNLTRYSPRGGEGSSLLLFLPRLHKKDEGLQTGILPTQSPALSGCGRTSRLTGGFAWRHHHACLIQEVVFGR